MRTATAMGMPRPLPHNDSLDARPAPLRLVRHAGPPDLLGTPREQIRAAAREADRQRGELEELHAAHARELWDGLVEGQLRLVDWFDSDGRRFIIAKPSASCRGRSRGLTKREREVAEHVARGESSKLTGYELGISPSRVSALLNAAMRKLGVRTKVQLVIMIRLLTAQRRVALCPAARRAAHDG